MLLKSDEAVSALRKYFKNHKLALLKDLSTVLGTQSRMSIFRRLSKMNYISSYTHSGAYYTLPEVIHFDENGLWIHEGIGFSQFGNLRQTITYLIESSHNGKTQTDLQFQLQIRVHNTLLDLYRKHMIDRVKVNGVNIYVSRNVVLSKKQLSKRDADIIAQSSSSLSNWLLIEVLVAIIQCNKINVNSEDILRRLEIKNNGITLIQIDAVISKFNLKKTLDS